MQLTKAEARQVVRGDHLDWSPKDLKITGRHRWSLTYSGVFEHQPTGKHYRLRWNEAATELQDERPFDNTSPVLTEVEWKDNIAGAWIPVQ